MPRKFLPVCAPILPRHGGFFKLKVMSMIACPSPFWRSATTYEDDELDTIEKVVAPLAKNLADNLKEMVLPSWK